MRVPHPWCSGRKPFLVRPASFGNPPQDEAPEAPGTHIHNVLSLTRTILMFCLKRGGANVGLALTLGKPDHIDSDIDRVYETGKRVSLFTTPDFVYTGGILDMMTAHP